MTMQLMPLVIFWAIVTAFIVCVHPHAQTNEEAALTLRIDINLTRHLVAVHPPELGIIQRLKHIADEIPFSSSFQILAADPRSGCIF